MRFRFVSRAPAAPHGGVVFPSLLAALALLGLVSPLRAATPKVAVLLEPGMVVYGGTPSLGPTKVVRALATRGVPSVPITAAQAADPKVLNAQRFTVLLIPTGNAFPEDAYGNLRAFHAAGGCLITTGVPFTHPCRKTDGQWRDLGHDGTRMGHGAQGIGTGGFEEALAAPSPRMRAVASNPLGFGTSMLPCTDTNPQALSVASLAPEDEVIPIVEVVAPGGARRVATALIRHRCPQFKGALDLWAGPAYGQSDALDRFTAEQLQVRAILWCLAEKGALPKPRLRAQLAALDRVPKPGPLPANLPILAGKRSWGDTFMPKSNPPARRLLVVDTQKMKPEERVALACLQGLTSRKQPVIWLVTDRYTQFWLDWHQQKGHIDGYDRVADWTSLFRRFRGVAKGAVVPDPKLYRSGLLAANVAACEDLVVAPPELAKRLGLPVKRDLRGRFATYAEGLRWLWGAHKGKLNPFFLDMVHPNLLPNGAFAYALQWRGLMVWPAGTVDDKEPGADMVTERRLFAEILAQMPPGGVSLGFPYAGEGVGLGEGDGVALLSRYGKSLVCSDFLTNATVTSGVRVPPFHQPAQPPAPKLEKDKVYIALVTSDGDNQNTWIDFFRQWFLNPAFGKFPVALGLGPAIYDLQPAVAQWYYEHAAPNTEFVSDVSGAGYTQPPNFGIGFKHRERVYTDFLGWTSRLMRKMDMRTIRLVEGNDTEVARTAKALPFCHSLLPDMGRYSGREGIRNLTYTAPSGMPVFRAVTSWRYGKDGFLREVREQVGQQRPAFVNGFVHVWTFQMDDLARIYANRDPDMVFVTPAQLAELYKQSLKR
ncbi:MAG TPA: GxGYxYP domain-containing protein, partial [Armatimonadota bacterium]